MAAEATFCHTLNMFCTRVRAAGSFTVALSGPPSVRYGIVAVFQTYGSPFVNTASGPPALASPAASNPAAA